MTITLNLTPQAEARLREQAHQLGEDLSTYLTRELGKVALPEPSRLGARITPPLSGEHRSGAEILAEWEGIPSIYARYSEDSPELARMLRSEAEAGIDGQLAASA